MQKYFSSPREFNVMKYRHHRTLVTLAGLVAAGYFLSQYASGETLVDAILDALHIFATMLLTWSITREIDPDRPDSAIGAAAIAGVGVILLASTTNLLASFTLILVMRALNHSTGLPFRLGDVLVTVILVGLTARSEQWVIGLVAGLAFWLDSVAEDPSPYARINALIVVAMTLLIAYLSDALEWSFVFTNADIAALITAFVATRFVVPSLPDPLKSVGDYTGEPLDRRRVLYTITLMALTLLLVSWSGDDDTALGMLPLWAGLLALIVYHARERFSEGKI